MGDIMETFGGPLRRMAYRDFRSGENMTQFSLAPLIERTGSRPCPVSRAELQREMLDYWGRDKRAVRQTPSPAVKKTPTA
ncbi:putative flavoprotein monooxygenase [Klebsiella pneumoniae]|uniref:Putative flavoprotein monooxygenase n=1 Tax=Klebsiella pneumoniae TaxID=573 RepID=A0A377XAK6_KLEPN|nr:putative flavoprotein monooxygenase [Klebsiella pneumoniae]